MTVGTRNQNARGGSFNEQLRPSTAILKQKDMKKTSIGYKEEKIQKAQWNVVSQSADSQNTKKDENGYKKAP